MSIAITVDTVLTQENFPEYISRARRCDHGHAIFDNGREIEFGYIVPKLEEVQGKTVRVHWEECAREWVEGDKVFYGVPIKQIWLAG